MNDSNFSRLFIIMMLALVLLAISLMVLASFASSDVNQRLDARSDIENSNSIAERLAPVGQFAADTSAVTLEAVAPIVLSGEEAYTSCAACHAAGIAGAPALGDAASWSTRIAQGIDTLYSHAIKGFQGSTGFMPAKGGNTALSDESVRAAVDYMVEKSR